MPASDHAEELDEGHIHTDDTNYVFVIHIKRYLEKASAGPAMAYLANRLGLGGVAVASQLIPNAQELDDLLDLNLNKSTFIRWMDRNPDQIAMIREILTTDDLDSTIPRDDMAGTIRAVTKFSPELYDAMLVAIGSGGPDAVLHVANGLSGNLNGRRTISDVLADQLPNRLEDARLDSNRYRELLLGTESNETILHDFINRHPWLLGMEYVRVHSKQTVARGEVDFMVQRHDGYYDLLELKGPNDPIIQCNFKGRGPHPPSAYSLGSSLCKALAQVQYYRERMASSEDVITSDYGLQGHTRDPRVIIINWSQNATYQMTLQKKFCGN